MKRLMLLPALLFLLFLAISASAQANAPLEKVLTRMDQAAAGFKSLQAGFTWDQYQKVVNETDTQKGTIYYRQTGKGVEMAADISQPDQKYVLFSEGKARVYQPRIDQITEYNAGKNKAAFESFLVLGFGGRGHDLPKQFDVKYDGEEIIQDAKTGQGIRTAKLELSPKAPKVKGMFDRIILWIDPARGLSVQQQFIEPTGDYRLAKYYDLKLNENLPGDAFKLHTTGKTKTVTAG